MHMIMMIQSRTINQTGQLFHVEQQWIESFDLKFVLRERAFESNKLSQQKHVVRQSPAYILDL